MATAKISDVCIVGGGIFGLCTAWACVQRGLSVRVVEAAFIGAGASGGVVGAMAPHTPEAWNDKKQFQYEALCSADAFWGEVDAASGLSSGYGRIGREIPLVDARALELAKMRRDQAQDLWHGAYSWKIAPASDLLIADAAPFGVVRDTLSARIHPLKACHSLAAALRQAGVEIVEGEAVVDIGDGRVTTNGASSSAKAIVLADGVQGLDRLGILLGQNIGSGVKGQAAVLAADLQGHPQIYADGIYIVPHADGTTAIGSTSENAYEDATSIDVQLETLIEAARKLVPALRDASVLQRWAGVRPKGRRRDPMIGRLPGYHRVYAANSAFKIGFGIAHKIGASVADMITDTHVTIPDSFRVEHHLSRKR